MKSQIAALRQAQHDNILFNRYRLYLRGIIEKVTYCSGGNKVNVMLSLSKRGIYFIYYKLIYLKKDQMKLFYVYIVKCSDASYYTGFTNNIDERIMQHNSGLSPSAYTFTRRPVELVWVEMFTDPNHAITLEKQIKGWSRRKKEALINQDWDKLVEFSKNYTQYGKPEEGADNIVD